MQESMLQLIRERRYVSFWELELYLPRFSGPLALEQGQDGSNVILWHRCSAEGIAALSALLQQEVVTTEAVEVMVYLLDGCPASVLPPLPLAHGRNYPSPHWLPVTLTAVGTCLPAPHTLTQ